MCDRPSCGGGGQENCTNGVDDANGFTDCDDPTCADPVVVTELKTTANGNDDDGDGTTDCDDSDCTTDPACLRGRIKPIVQMGLMTMAMAKSIVMTPALR